MGKIDIERIAVALVVISGFGTVGNLFGVTSLPGVDLIKNGFSIFLLLAWISCVLLYIALRAAKKKKREGENGKEN